MVEQGCGRWGCKQQHDAKLFRLLCAPVTRQVACNKDCLSSPPRSIVVEDLDLCE